jgi:hypothetical protein
MINERMGIGKAANEPPDAESLCGNRKKSADLSTPLRFQGMRGQAR